VEIRLFQKLVSEGHSFFAHARRGPCESAKESESHHRLKGILAAAAKNAGWSVTTEWRGQTDSGEEWIADVFCTKGRVFSCFLVWVCRQLGYIVANVSIWGS